MNNPVSDVEYLRDLNAAAALVKAYGGSLPAEVEAARDLYHRLRTAPPGSPDLRVIGALAIDETPAKAAKALAEANVAHEVHKASMSVAASRALRTLAEHADEVAASVLASSILAEAVAEIEAVAGTVRPDVPYLPDPVSHGEDEVVAAARLRRAEGVLDRAATGLASVNTLGAYFDPDRVGLMWLDPAGVTDPSALHTALRGIRAGHVHVPVWTTRVGTAGPVQEQAARGIRSASATAASGVRFALIESLDDYEERLRTFERGLSAPRGAKPAPADSRVVVLGD